MSLAAGGSEPYSRVTSGPAPRIQGLHIGAVLPHLFALNGQTALSRAPGHQVV